MKAKIHPKYVETTVTCGCGESFTTRSTKAKILVEVCSQCHPFYTGKQKFVDSAGMVERFTKRWKSGAAQEKAEVMKKRKIKKAIRSKKARESKKTEKPLSMPPPAPQPRYAGQKTQNPPTDKH